MLSKQNYPQYFLSEMMKKIMMKMSTIKIKFYLRMKVRINQICTSLLDYLTTVWSIIDGTEGNTQEALPCLSLGSPPQFPSQVTNI